MEKQPQAPQPLPRNGGKPSVPDPIVALPGSARYLFLSELLKMSVRFEGESAPCGRLVEVGVQNVGYYPTVCSVQVRPSLRARGRELGAFAWSSVLEIAERALVLKKDSQPKAGPVDLWLRRDVLDDQVIDISGAKVVRVNDLHLLHAEGQMLVVHVDVGILGILRRLRYERVVAGLLRWLFDYTLKDALISWRYVELAGFEGFGGRLRIPTAPSRLAEMHPAELADIMEQLGTKERQRLINSLPVETAAEALEEVDPELQRAVIAQQDPGKAADILEEMNSTDAADVLRDLHASEAQVIISWMEREAQEDIRAILTHEEKSAGGVMSTACIETRPDQFAGEVLEYVRSVAGDAEVFNQIYVLDEGRHLLGVLSLRELLLAKTDAPLRTLMTTDVVSLDPDASLQAVAAIFVKYGFRAIPVVDKNNVFLGAIRLINVLSKLSRFFKGLTE